MGCGWGQGAEARLLDMEAGGSGEEIPSVPSWLDGRALDGSPSLPPSWSTEALAPGLSRLEVGVGRGEPPGHPLTPHQEVVGGASGIFLILSRLPILLCRL